MREPRFGTFLFTSQFEGLSESDVFGAALRYAERAEAAGFDDLWVDEHHFLSWGINPSALTLAAFLLGRTRRVRVGTAVVLLPQLPPVFVAEQAALLDHVSGGRFDLGIGRGGPSIDLAVAGRSFAHWAEGFWPAVDLMRAAWTGKANGATALERFPEVPVRPMPATSPHPPLLAASVSPASLEQAARRGIPLLLFLHETDGTRRRAVDRWAEIAADHGHPTEHPGHAFAVLGHVTEPGEPVEPLRRTLTSFFERSSSEYVMLPEADPATAHPPERLRELVAQILARHPIGPPEECIARLAGSIEGSGIDRVLLMLEAGAEPARVERNVTAFGEHVIPAVRRRLDPAVR